MNCIKNERIKNEIIKNERIKNERIKNELIKKRTDPTCGGLDSKSATMLRQPGTRMMLDVNSAI